MRILSASLTGAETITRLTGLRPAGWAGQDFGESTRTPQLLAEAGFRYVLDWPNDDQPYLLSTRPAIVSIPNQAEWDDVQQQWLRRLPAHRFPALVSEAFSVLRAEAGDSGRVFGLGVHPWLSGMARRIRYLREALAAIPAAADVWRTTPGAIASAFAKRRHLSRSCRDETGVLARTKTRQCLCMIGRRFGRPGLPQTPLGQKMLFTVLSAHQQR